MQNKTDGNTKLGLGLIGIGRPWGYVTGSVPTEQEVLSFLEYAYTLGIRFFDTAPAYGSSEERLGKFVAMLHNDQRKSLTIATKLGEHWNNENNTTYVDHSVDALISSLDNSMRHLGRIDILQLHKSSLKVLRKVQLGRVWDYAKSLGVASIGASVSDLESAQFVINDNTYNTIQFPLNTETTTFRPIVNAADSHMLVVTNRPFNMGKLVHESSIQNEVSKVALFNSIIQINRNGVILTGTKSKIHLRENHDAFNQAMLSAI